MEILPRFKIQYPMKNRCKYRLQTNSNQALIAKHAGIVYERMILVDKQIKR